MKSSYNFEEQINSFNDIFQNNITLAQRANSLLHLIPVPVLTKIVQELKSQYQKKYSQDYEKYSSIRNTLNLVARQQVTDIDKLFIDLAQEINQYYQKQLVKVQKKVQYSKSCPICKAKVANDSLNLRWHIQKCKALQQKSENSAPQRKSKKRGKDTQERYQQRQKMCPLPSPELNVSTSDQRSPFLAQNPPKQKKLQNKKKTDIKKQKQISKLHQFLENLQDKQEIFFDESEPPKVGSQAPQTNLDLLTHEKKQIRDKVFESEDQKNQFLE